MYTMLQLLFIIAIIYVIWKFVLPWLNKEFGIGAGEIFGGIAALVAWALKLMPIMNVPREIRWMS